MSSDNQFPGFKTHFQIGRFRQNVRIGLRRDRHALLPSGFLMQTSFALQSSGTLCGSEFEIERHREDLPEQQLSEIDNTIGTAWRSFALGFEVKPYREGFQSADQHPSTTGGTRGTVGGFGLQVNFHRTGIEPDSDDASDAVEPVERGADNPGNKTC